MMSYGIMPEQRTICLIPIPFTDLSSTKKRPVLIISNDNYNQISDDVLVMGITSNIEPRKYTVLIDDGDMETGTLLSLSMIRTDKIYSINKHLIIKNFGKLNNKKFEESLKVLNELLTN
jgi:mRNA interferase MazF